MRADRPSLTAAFVAFARGVGLKDERVDEMARTLLPAPFGELLNGFERAGTARTMLRSATRGATLGLVDHIGLRTAAIDDAVREGLRRGARQLVLLGAGLDARAWRMRELADIDVYEVDHPATQHYKRVRVEGYPTRARTVSFVPVDFERQPLGRALAEVGQDETRPTMWVWEGVTPYLQHTSLVATLGEVASRSASESTLALTYALPEHEPLNDSRRRLAEAAFRVMGEPLVGSMPSAEAAHLIEGASFRMVSDTGSEDWARIYGGSRTLPALFRAERLAVAIRKSE